MRSTEVATPVHSGASSSVTDEKREKLREWVRAQMRAGEMSGEPETLEHRQSVPQQSTSRQWEGSIDKNTRSAGAEEGVKARQDMDVPDDFFEDDKGNEDHIDHGVPAYMRSVELPAKRKPDEAVDHPDEHPKRAEKHPKKEKRRKHREAASPPMQDSFFGDKSE